MIDVLVVGFGIIGSWIAYLAAKQGMVVAVCEKGQNPGDGISGRNSGVLHSGIYYPQDSEKVKYCMRGYQLGLEFFQECNVPHRISGKLITTGKARDEKDRLQRHETLHKLLENGKRNGVAGLEIVEHPGREYSGVLGDLAIHVPSTGIVDVPEYLKTLWHLGYEYDVITLKSRKFTMQEGQPKLVSTRGEVEEIEAEYIVNAGGLYGDEVAREFGLVDYEIRANKGEYYRIKKPLPYQKLIYPIPSPTSTALGVHYTFNIAGEAYAGPNSNWAQSKEDYHIQTPRDVYYSSLCNILDCYQEDDLEEGYAGLRPRLFYRGEAWKDFVIEEYPQKVIHLLGIESPGLTSSPAIAEEVVARIVA
ncbi:MAG: FAD-dependent oxidoreductase [Spirochaetota bacterium]